MAAAAAAPAEGVEGLHGASGASSPRETSSIDERADASIDEGKSSHEEAPRDTAKGVKSPRRPGGATDERRASIVSSDSSSSDSSDSSSDEGGHRLKPSTSEGRRGAPSKRNVQDKLRSKLLRKKSTLVGRSPKRTRHWKQREWVGLKSPGSQEDWLATQDSRQLSQPSQPPDDCPAYKENDWVCSHCFDGGTLLCCDTCAAVYHLTCVNLIHVPDGDWSCPKCVPPSPKLDTKELKRKLLVLGWIPITMTFKTSWKCPTNNVIYTKLKDIVRDFPILAQSSTRPAVSCRART